MKLTVLKICPMDKTKIYKNHTPILAPTYTYTEYTTCIYKSKFQTDSSLNITGKRKPVAWMVLVFFNFPWQARKALRVFCFGFQDNNPPTHLHFSERIHFFALPQNSNETVISYFNLRMKNSGGQPPQS